MQLDVIEMDRSEARKAFLDYRRAVRERHDAEDAAIMRGYRELAQGRQLIRLSETIRAGGLDERGMPRLGVSQADRTQVYFHGYSNHRGSTTVVFADESPRDLNPRRQRGVYRFRDIFPDEILYKTSAWGRNPFWKAIVPNVPPALRPRHHLRNYAVLFEAEWERDPVPPRDPALLKRLGGDLYTVLAVWDLTDIERAVLFGTRADA